MTTNLVSGDAAAGLSPPRPMLVRVAAGMQRAALLPAGVRGFEAPTSRGVKLETGVLE